MSARKLGLGSLGLVLCGGLGCNEIAGIKPAEENPLAESCSPYYEISAARAVGCMFRIACDPFLPPYTMSECVGMSWQDAAAAESCTYAAESCSDIDACIGRRYEPADACTGDSGWICDDTGNRAINCTGSGQYSVDCELFGGVCMPHASTTVPSAYACQHVPAPTCPDDAQDGDYFCEGTQRFTCIDGEPRGVDCAGVSSECIEYEPGVAFCSDRTEVCDNIGDTTCDGDVIDVCDSDGYRVRFDCSSEDLRCAEDSETDTIECLADGCETATDCTEGCQSDGVSVRFCSGGIPFVINCTEYGYDGCATDDIRGGLPLAYCARNPGSDPHP